MPTYYTLPSLYMGSDKKSYDAVKNAYRLNEDRFSSFNKFLEYLIKHSIETDPTLKRDRRTA